MQKSGEEYANGLEMALSERESAIIAVDCQVSGIYQ